MVGSGYEVSTNSSMSRQQETPQGRGKGDGGGRKQSEVVDARGYRLIVPPPTIGGDQEVRRRIESRGARMPKRPYSVGVGPRAMSCAGHGRASSGSDQQFEGDALTQGPNYAGGLAGSVGRCL